jgi:Meiotically up-regulated gene 113
LIYFIGHPDGRIKIGRSGNVSRRLRQLETGAGCRLTILGGMPGDSVVSESSLEADLHVVFGHLLAHREWFHPGQDLLRFIAKEGYVHLFEYLEDGTKAEYWQRPEDTTPVEAVQDLYSWKDYGGAGKQVLDERFGFYIARHGEPFQALLGFPKDESA